jgi:NADH-quinone oxidoreductase subunit B
MKIGGSSSLISGIYNFIRKVVLWIIFKTPLKKLRSWGISYSLWPVHLTTACCGCEFGASSAPRFDAERAGYLPFVGPRQTNLIVVEGSISKKMANAVRLTYEQMPNPKYVIALGACAIDLGIFYDSYNLVRVDEVVPVDVYVPGCPPRPEAIIRGVLMLQKKIRKGG